jgi:copper oxidase (laccase) domain-containing protein
MNEALGMEAWPFLYPLPGEKYGVDLKGLITRQLEKAGLKPTHIDCSDLCTACHPEEFWSHRRLGEARGNQAAMIQLLDR